MKRFLLTGAALAALIHPAGAQAQQTAFRPYVGFDLQRSSIDYSNWDAGGGIVINGDEVFQDNLNGFNIHAGSRLHENFGVELGYFRTRDGKKSETVDLLPLIGVPGMVSGTSKIKLQGVTLDALGYVSVSPWLDLIGTAGLAWTKADGNVTINVPGGAASESFDESELGFRLGGGAQFNLTDNIGLRALGRWQKADFEDSADDMWTYSVGLNFSF